MPTAMQPYDLADWVDYVRGLKPESEREAMTELLGRDAQAARDVAMLECVRDALQLDEPPPMTLAWTARAMAGVRPPPLLQLPRISLHLISIEPPPEPPDARRHPYLGARRLFYRGERLDLDLWLEDPHGIQTSILMGHLSLRDEERKASPVQGASVFLLEKGQVAASTLTNQYGEFHLEALPEGQLGLQILVQDCGRVDLAIPREAL